MVILPRRSTRNDGACFPPRTLGARVPPKEVHRGFLFMMDKHSTLIAIEAVSKHYGPASDGVLALREITLNVRAGEFLSIIGPSGCGKSTLLKLVGDLLTPSTGRITIGGRMPAESRQARECALVFQSPTLMDWRNVRQNIELPLEILGIPSDERTQRAQQLLRMIRLSEFGPRFPRELSIGMQQQVAIARALAYRPSILLMDEPFGALDEMTRERLGRELLDIWEQMNVTVLFVTHSVSEAVMLSDRVAVLSPRPGRIERVIPIDLPRPRTPDMREAPQFAQLVRELRAALRLNGTSNHRGSQSQ